MKKTLLKIYQSLYTHFGPLDWWPGNTPFEIIVGAILTQNTSWMNVEKAIMNLKEAKLLHPQKIHSISEKKLAYLIRPSGYFNVKSKRLKNFINFYMENYEGSSERMFAENSKKLRNKLLLVNGIGQETADAILLYAGKKPFFVVDAYTKRIFSRHHLISKNDSYRQVQELFTKNLPKNVELYNEFHAQIVMLGKTICTSKNQKCSLCPINYLEDLRN